MYHKVIEAVLSLTLVALCLGTEDNGQAHILDDDSEFYRFGRSLLQHYDADDEPYTDQNWLSHPSESLSPDLEGNALLRDRREFYRFGRSQLPLEEKRFLRFGRSVHVADSNKGDHIESMKPVYRKRRELGDGRESEELLHHSKRSVQSNDARDDQKNSEANKKFQKRETSSLNVKHDNQISNGNALNENLGPEKKFMRFGKRFMRFGRGDEDIGDYEKRFMRFGRDQEDDSDYEKRFMRFGKRFDGDEDFDKRFMRFGKRFMRFGRGNEDQEHNTKRFMRFGRRNEDQEHNTKRFMRFGKNVDYNEDPEKRFMRFGKSVDYNEDPEKRFMRFGKNVDYIEDPEKRFMRFGKSADYIEDPEKKFMRFGKRFMRFGKRFMRFGRQGLENDNQLLNMYSDNNDIDTGHLEKSSR